ncbi:MAG: hypothetical protein KDA57_17430 [Planctomycetales bacterium]|nr:hypothetical protein [Planctomycetales bacterium]
MGDTGLETIGLSDLHHNGLRDEPIERGAKSDAISEVAALAAEIDPGLAAVVDAWPILPPSAQMAIETIVEAARVTAFSERE